MKRTHYGFSKGPGELVILGLLLKTHMHGYQIFQTLCESELKIIHALCMREGTLYPLLYRLEKKSLIRGNWVKAGEKRKRRHYHITKKGRDEYARQRECWLTITRAVQKVCTDKSLLNKSRIR